MVAFAVEAYDVYVVDIHKRWMPLCLRSPMISKCLLLDAMNKRLINQRATGRPRLVNAGGRRVTVRFVPTCGDKAACVPKW